MIIEVDDKKNYKLPKITDSIQMEIDKVNYNSLSARIEQQAYTPRTTFDKPIKSKLSQDLGKKLMLSNAKLYKIKYLKKVSRLGEKSCFGELALLMEQPRTATVKVVQNTVFATLSKDNFNKILKNVHDEGLLKKLELLDQVPYINQYSKAFKSKVTRKL